MAAMLTGCSLGKKQEVTGADKYPEFLTVDVFDSQANYQGIQQGWFAKLVKDKFNMQLNIIAPNVAGGGDALYDTRCANGNLGDLIFTNADNGRLNELAVGDLLLDLTPYMDEEEHLAARKEAITSLAHLTSREGMWAVPSMIAEEAGASEPTEIEEPTNGACLRWDLYQKTGGEKIETLEDLLPVLKKMQEAQPYTSSGRKAYAFSLFGDWDDNLMQNAGALGALYGYDPQGYVMLNVENGDIKSIIEDDSPYVRALRFLCKANQMGLVDPESPVQGYDAVAQKYTDGAVLYSLWPWLGTGQYNSERNLAQGKGFATIKIEDARYLCWGNFRNGYENFAVMIGSKTKDPRRMADFVDWLYSPEGIETSGSPNGNFSGPEGLTWTMENDEPVLTEFGYGAFVEKKEDLAVPEEWGGGTWSGGISQLNYKATAFHGEDPERGVPYCYMRWDDYREKTQNTVQEEWCKFYDTTLLPIDYFKEQGKITVVPGNVWESTPDTASISTIREQCRQTIIDSSWSMVFAESDEEFEEMLQEMQSVLIRLGYKEALAVDMENAQARYQAICEARNS